MPVGATKEPFGPWSRGAGWLQRRGSGWPVGLVAPVKGNRQAAGRELAALASVERAAGRSSLAASDAIGALEHGRCSRPGRAGLVIATTSPVLLAFLLLLLFPFIVESITSAESAVLRVQPEPLQRRFGALCGHLGMKAVSI